MTNSKFWDALGEEQQLSFIGLVAEMRNVMFCWVYGIHLNAAPVQHALLGAETAFYYNFLSFFFFNK